MPCYEPSCTRRNLSGYWYCRHHNCRTKRCYSKNVDGVSYCEEHRCGVLTCSRPHRSGISACSSHKCKLSQCNSIRYTGRQHCQAHMCGRNTCHRARKVGGSLACETHTCRLLDSIGNAICRNIVQQNPGSTSCFDHVCCLDSCRRPYISIDIPYCQRHRCQWTVGGVPCPQAADTPSRFCEQHKCPVTGCKRSCLEAGKYCDDHRCYWGDRECPKESFWSLDGWYCPNHTCSVARCMELNVADGFQCDAHTCVGAEDGVRCNVEVNHAGDRCSQHCCLERNCYDARDGEGGYCAQHVCSSDDCYDRRGASGRYCEYHRAEYQQQTAVVATRSPRGVARSQATRNNMQDYGTGYLDGYQLGLNVPEGNREFARTAMEQWGRDSGHDAERAERRQGMAGVAGLVTQMEMQGDGVASLGGQPRLIEEVPYGQQQTLGDLITGVNSLDLNQARDSREDHTDSGYVVELV